MFRLKDQVTLTPIQEEVLEEEHRTRQKLLRKLQEVRNSLHLHLRIDDVFQRQDSLPYRFVDYYRLLRFKRYR
jgi:hypothetical protein